MNTKLSKIIILAIVACCIGCDQVSKEIVRDKIEPGQRIEVIDNHFTLLKTENTGAFLSLGNDLSPTLNLILLKIAPLLLILFMLGQVLLGRGFSNLAILGYCLVIGGGIGNIIDRFLYGSVTDFIYLEWGIFRTGIFNMADVSITTGVVFLVIALLKGGLK